MPEGLGPTQKNKKLLGKKGLSRTILNKDLAKKVCGSFFLYKAKFYVLGTKKCNVSLQALALAISTLLALQAVNKIVRVQKVEIEVASIMLVKLLKLVKFIKFER